MQAERYSGVYVTKASEQLFINSAALYVSALTWKSLVDRHIKGLQLTVQSDDTTNGIPVLLL